MALAVAALCFAERRAVRTAKQRPTGRALLGLSEKFSVAAPLGGVCLLILVLVLWLGNGHLEAFASITLLVVTASGIATLAVAICTTLTAALRP